MLSRYCYQLNPGQFLNKLNYATKDGDHPPDVEACCQQRGLCLYAFPSSQMKGICLQVPLDMAEGMLVRWVKLEGEAINKGDVLAEIETDKATVEVESSVTGTVARHLVEKGSSVPVGTAIALIALAGEKVEDVAAGAPTGEAAKPTAVAAPQTQASQALDVKPADEQAPAGPLVAGEVKASPLARKMAIDAGLDLRGMRGSGPEGRIVKRDVEAALKSPPIVTAPVATATLSTAPAQAPVKAVPLFVLGNGEAVYAGGTLVGRALEPLEEGDGMIQVLVQLR